MATVPERERPGRITRFSGSERALHWLLAVTFFVMLATGLALYVPALANLIDRPTAKAWHIDAAIALAAGVVLTPIVSWHRFRRVLREIDRFDRDDARWLLNVPRRLFRRQPSPPQGRFNAGQKLNAAVVGGLLVVAFVTGTLLWYGERNTRYRFAGTVIVHDWVTWILIVIVSGHLYLALLHPGTRHALRGMTLGSVDREWARRHHAKWVTQEEIASDGHAGDERLTPRSGVSREEP